MNISMASLTLISFKNNKNGKYVSDEFDVPPELDIK